MKTPSHASTGIWHRLKPWRRRGSLLLAIASLGLLLGGCNEIFRAYQFTLTGTISLASGATASGPIVVELYHKQTGEGTLQQPLLFVSSFKLDKPGPLRQEIEFPVTADRTGLVVYAWHDGDGDGSLCAIGVSDESAGLIDVQGFPKREVTLALTLDQACLGPEALYP